MTDEHPAVAEAFRHDALLYEGQDDFVARASAFIGDGIEAGEPVLVAIPSPKIALLRRALGGAADDVHFVHMEDAGRNPGRIISLWHTFVEEHGRGGQRIRGIGEPIWSGRSGDEIVESQRHEALLNLAFEGVPLWLVCPYDTTALDPAVIEQAHRSHPFIVDGRDGRGPSVAYDAGAARQPFDHPLPEPPGPVQEIAVKPGFLDEMRSAVAAAARAFGLGPDRTDDLVFAVNEVATNSLRHGNGGATLWIWPDGDAIVCEVRDGGRIADPLVGREPPRAGQERGLGLWLVNQLCDLVQVRMLPDGVIVRLRMSRG